MKIMRATGGTSFYESFSDLIFCTLIIFVVVVMALAIQIRPVPEEIAVERPDEPELVSNRFSGAPGEFFIHMVIVRVDGRTALMPIPTDITEVLEAIKSPGNIDPVLSLCELAKTPEGLPILKAEAFIGLAGGVSEPFAKGAYMHWDVAVLVNRILELERRDPARFRQWSATRLRDEIGGVEALDGLLGGGRSTWTRPEIDHDFLQWRRNGGSDVYSRRSECTQPLADAAARLNPGADPFIRFRVTDDRRVVVGDTTLSREDFKCLLSALKPGRGFYVEYTDREPGAEMPVWVVEELLRPTGFDKRIQDAG